MAQNQKRGSSSPKRWSVKAASEVCKVFRMNLHPVLTLLATKDRLEGVYGLASQYLTEKKGPKDVKGHIQKTFLKHRNQQMVKCLIRDCPNADGDADTCRRFTERMIERPGVIGETPETSIPGSRVLQKSPQSQAKLKEALDKRKLGLSKLPQFPLTNTRRDSALRRTLTSLESSDFKVEQNPVTRHIVEAPEDLLSSSIQ